MSVPAEDEVSIFELFNQYFELVHVDNDALLRKAQNLRYQVYCVEHHFESQEDHPDHVEEDDFDHESVHTLLSHTVSGEFAATVRLVLPKALGADGLFPIEQHSQIHEDKQHMIQQIPRHDIAEISRFAVSKTFRRRLGEILTSHGITDEAEINAHGKRLVPHITLGLFKAIVRMSVENDIRYWYAVMEPILIRLLKRFGIHFVHIGPVVEYHGKRVPCWADSITMLDGIHKHRPDVWDFITESGQYV